MSNKIKKSIIMANGIDLLNPKKEILPTPPTKPINPNKEGYTSKVITEQLEITNDPDQKKIVIPNLAPSISALMARHKAGIPNTIATRTLESYYRDTDLTDIEQINKSYLELSEKVQNQVEKQKQLKQQAKAKQQEQQKKILEFMQQQQQTPPSP